MARRVMVAMSGGVDSSVAALLLKQQGHDVVGATMCLGVVSGEEETTKCCGPEAAEDARRVSDKLDVPHYVFDFSDALREKVIKDFVAEYGAGRTPNPCVRCNRFLKFGMLLNKARSLGFDALATGHYARIVEEKGEYSLRCAKDRSKDQTYFLYCIHRGDLSSILFPVGEHMKTRVRALAEESGLPVAHRAESQDICFVPGRDYREFLPARGLRETPGEIVDTHGKVLGTHRGITNFTVGQRKGLGIAAGAPLYVVAIDAGRDRVVAGNKRDLRSEGLTLSNVKVLVSKPPAEAKVKVRYAQPGVACRISWQGDTARVVFATPQEAVTPGQSAVLYDGDMVLGGGIIERSVPAHD